MDAEIINKRRALLIGGGIAGTPAIGYAKRIAFNPDFIRDLLDAARKYNRGRFVHNHKATGKVKRGNPYRRGSRLPKWWNLPD